MSNHPDIHEFQSPFRLPTDEEVFITREAERLQKQEIKEKLKDIKIWDKQTACTKGQLKRPNESSFQVKPIEENQYQQFTRPKERNLITAALEIVSQRSKLPQSQKTENIRDYVEQKKEIFRVEMKYRILKDEREKIRKRISNKESALKRSEEMLNNDYTRFTEHIDKNKRTKEEAINRANQETQAKKEKETEIKQLEQRKAGITAEISRNEELLESLKKHKEFLDRLTPPDWLNKQKLAFQYKYQQLKNNWVQKQSLEDSYETLNDPEIDSKDSISSISGKKPRNLSLAKNKNLEKKFDELVARGIINVYSEDDEKMYFTDPDQLSTILKEFEDNNLFLIELIQEMDHTLEVAKSELDYFKVKNEKKIEETRREKDMLSKSLNLNREKLSMMTRRISSIENKKESNKSAQNLRDEIGKCYASMGFENDSGLQPIEMLKIIENKINSLLNDVKFLRYVMEEKINKLEQEKETERREFVREQAQLRKEKDDNIRIAKAQERANNPSIKKIGRSEMKKVLMQQKSVEKEERSVQKSLEEQIREFIEETAN
ncbi:hypothetical protein SteCoe_32808 [Stentor coeruleus]|uniref:DUF4200 domain-containing protein n=1 Tax=Stentor coeruleus TaxID=5963 RepID=A0A1R2AY58_9CILI|nr:hypothetical protein SteCoe_32808 [Stentor coeruleus]